MELWHPLDLVFCARSNRFSDVEGMLLGLRLLDATESGSKRSKVQIVDVFQICDGPVVQTKL